MIDILYQFPTWIQHLYTDAFWRGSTDQPFVYLTFDDGPVPEVTPQVLDILDDYGVKATFFWVGENLLKYPNLAREVVERGHKVGNHTYQHLSGWKVDREQYISGIVRTNQLMLSTLGPNWQPTHLFRPPYGKLGWGMNKWLKQNGYHVVLWDIVTHDYNVNYTPERIMAIIQKYMRNGSVLLMHDSLKAQNNILVLLPQLLHWLQREGYQCVLIL